MVKAWKYHSFWLCSEYVLFYWQDSDHEKLLTAAQCHIDSFTYYYSTQDNN